MANLYSFPTLYAAASMLLHVGVVWVASAAPVPSSPPIAVLVKHIDVELDPVASLATATAREMVNVRASFASGPARSSAPRSAIVSRIAALQPSAAKTSSVETNLAPAALGGSTTHAPPTVPRFVLDSSSALVTSRGDAAASSNGIAGALAPEAETVPEELVSVRARLLSGGAAAYPSDARVAEIEADVPLEIVVDAAGAVIQARALTTPGYGLAAAALRAVRGYRFSPASREGRPVQVRMRWTVQFRLR